MATSKKDSSASEYNKPYLKCRGQEFLIVGRNRNKFKYLCAWKSAVIAEKEKKVRERNSFSFHSYSY